MGYNQIISGSMSNTSNEEKVLLGRALRKKEIAIQNFNLGYYDETAINLQVGLELFLKSKLLTYGIDYPRTQSLVSLIGLLIKITKNITLKEIRKTDLQTLLNLESAHILAVYNTDKIYTKEELLQFINICNKVYKSGV